MIEVSAGRKYHSFSPQHKVVVVHVDCPDCGVRREWLDWPVEAEL